jgi:uncharacterized protein (TIGR01777 family)
MKVAVTGATGFIGRHLTESLIERGDEVLALTRNPQRAAKVLPPQALTVPWRPGDPEGPVIDLGDCDAVVNLAGENLSAGRWTRRRREALLQSRLDGIRSIAEALHGLSGKPVTLIQASAVGFYGPRGDETLSEASVAGNGYLSEIAERCENHASLLAGAAVRVVSIRTGIVLGREAGLLPLLFTPLRLGFGGFPGHGDQWISWIHVEDEVRAISHLLGHGDLNGPFNLCAPEPLPMRDFVRLGGKLLHRPVWFPLPASLLRIIFGEMADEALLTGQRVLPSKLMEAGFVFSYPTAESAMRNLLV